ncbi:MAG: MerR family transcriptional regulator [Caldilineaceae bacterium]|nr:MerR family transcriptional regulator [Caldilineaceae bacterium]
MNSAIQLSEYSASPLYNIKAVVQATQISPSTLRAWERRYNMFTPERSASGYRLYSDRDIVIIQWLKTQVDAGMSISQAVAWLESLIEEADDGYASAILPASTHSSPAQEHIAPAQRHGVRDFSSLQQGLLNALLRFDEAACEEALSAAFSLYTIEQVGEELIKPVLVEVGERWHRNEINVTTEHFATHYLMQRLHALLRAVPNTLRGELIWIGCAPHEQHEVGALLLAIYARRAGYRVHYLGPDIPLSDLFSELKRQQPVMVVLSASTLESANELHALVSHIADFGGAVPLIGFGGQVFNRQPALRNRIAGVYLGESALEAVDTIGNLLRNDPRAGGQNHSGHLG